MAWLPIEEVRGNHLTTAPVPVDWHQMPLSPAQTFALIPSPALTTDAADAPKLSLSQRGHTPVYQWQIGDQFYYIDAQTGALLAPLEASQASAFALQRYRGKGALHRTELLQQIPAEARGLQAPIWQVQFQDDEKTTFYLHAHTGQLLKVRTERWRWFDFMWMLHIMDYEEREDFNHGLLIISSALALLFSLSGVVLLIFSRKRLRKRS